LAIRHIFSKKKSNLSDQIYRMTGIRPGKLSIYREALRHSSVNDAQVPAAVAERKASKNDNERLEFLGDAILDAAIAELLFLRFPYRQEGFLTEMRTRIVNRDQMAYLCDKLGLVQIMEIKPELRKNHVAIKTIGSNALESLIGAIYLDKGYKVAKKFIVSRLVGQYLDLEKLMNTTISHKAVLLKWAQQNRKVVTWKHEKEGNDKNEIHVLTLLFDDEVIVTDKNRTRKMAEELCCEKACRQLGIA
jgi:ribonuclease III